MIKKIGLLLVVLLLAVAFGPKMVEKVSANAETPQLNLSHIECVDGKVEIHFVLVHTEETPVPGNLTFTDNGIGYSVSPDKFTGGTWHFNYYASDGYHDVTAASVEWNGVTYDLHNPDAYAGDYNCAPDPASASVSVGSCSWSETTGSLTSVTLTLDHASLTINGHTYTDSTVIQLPPGTYPYSWTAQEGYTGSGSGEVTVGDCTPADAYVLIEIGQCSWSGHSSTIVSFTISNAVLTLNGVQYTTSGSVSLAPGDYAYSWVAVQGYQGSGEGTIHIGSCDPQDPKPTPTVPAPSTGGQEGPSLWMLFWDWLSGLFG